MLIPVPENSLIALRISHGFQTEVSLTIPLMPGTDPWTTVVAVRVAEHHTVIGENIIRPFSQAAHKILNSYLRTRILNNATSETLTVQDRRSIIHIIQIIGVYFFCHFPTHHKFGDFLGRTECAYFSLHGKHEFPPSADCS